MSGQRKAGEGNAAGFCGGCGTRLEAGDLFCCSCGWKVEEDAPAPEKTVAIDGITLAVPASQEDSHAGGIQQDPGSSAQPVAGSAASPRPPQPSQTITQVAEQTQAAHPGGFTQPVAGSAASPRPPLAGETTAQAAAQSQAGWQAQPQPQLSQAAPVHAVQPQPGGGFGETALPEQFPQHAAPAAPAPMPALPKKKRRGPLIAVIAGAGAVVLVGAVLGCLALLGLPPFAAPEAPPLDTPAPAPAPKQGSELVKAVGDEVTLGSYGGKAIVWQALEVTEDKALLVSRDIVAVRQYDDLSGAKVNTADDWDAYSVNWQGSDVRAWLNGEFLSTAIPEASRNAVLTTRVSNQPNPSSGTSGGPDTDDKLFLLSIDEAQRYFATDELRAANATMTASDVNYVLDASTKSWSYSDSMRSDLRSRLAGGFQGTSRDYWYWLRSPGQHSGFAARVNGGGNDITVDGDMKGYLSIEGYYAPSSGGVRPAMWVSLDDLDAAVDAASGAKSSGASQTGGSSGSSSGSDYDVMAALEKGSYISILEGTWINDEGDIIEFVARDGYLYNALASPTIEEAVVYSGFVENAGAMGGGLCYSFWDTHSAAWRIYPKGEIVVGPEYAGSGYWTSDAHIDEVRIVSTGTGAGWGTPSSAIYYRVLTSTVLLNPELAAR